MNNEIEVRAAVPEDAEQMAQVMRGGFEDKWIRLSIYAYHGIADFIRQQIRIADMGADTVYAVAVSGSRVVGVVEMRRTPAALFMGYISVAPEARSAGVGKRLIAAAAAIAGPIGRQTMELDVLDIEDGAKTWYERMGFVMRYRGRWWLQPLEKPAQPAMGLLCNYPQSETCHARYGFSTLNIRTAQGDYSIGRLGDELFRITQPAALTDPGVLTALCTLDSSCRVFSILPDDQTPPIMSKAAEPLAGYCRMSASLDELLSRLPAAWDGYSPIVTNVPTTLRNADGWRK